MKIQDVTAFLERLAPLAYQETYDNSGLITGQKSWTISGIICALDATAAVVDEAMSKNCNLIVVHHPIIFSGLKKLSGSGYVEQAIVKAIKNDIAIYAIHTNLDNILQGVNGWIAKKIGLLPNTISVLSPKQQVLAKLYTYAPISYAEDVKNALFAAGGGHIGEYQECSFATTGTGTFQPLDNANPFIGQAGGARETLEEIKIEVIFPLHHQNAMVKALRQSHPYEEVAFEIVKLENEYKQIGSGIVGKLPAPMAANALLGLLKNAFNLQVIKHTAPTDKPIQTIAVCGGAGSFLTKQAIATGADAYITADIKYHEFFEANGQLMLVDIGHYESEQFTIDGLAGLLQANFPTFAVLKTEINTNPVSYFL